MLRESGGNPFYIEQLVRAGAALPGGVAEAIAGELRALDDPQRRLLEGAAVAGDPFEPELAAAAAEIDDALEPLDGLLAAGLVRATDVPRQFTFRHPLVRRAVYEGAPGGWRLGAHARVARTLASRGAPPTILAHHVEFSAQPGDAQAVALLRAAGDMVRPRTPASAARWYEAALRLVAGAELDPAVGGPAARSSATSPGAEAAAGRLERSRRAVLEALVLVDPASEESVRLVTACAAVEHWLGRHEDARRRLHAALDQHGDSQALKLELAFDALYGLDLGTSAERARAALDGPDRGASASAAALLALVLAADGQRAAAQEAVHAATSTLAGLDDRTLAAQLQSLWYLAWAETFLDHYEAALEHSRRGLELSRATGQDWLVVPLLLAPVFALEMQGRVTEARETATAAVDAARLAGNPHHLAWALWEYGLTLWYAGEVPARAPRWRRATRSPTRPGATCSGSPSPAGRSRPSWPEEGDLVASRATGAALVRRLRPAISSCPPSAASAGTSSPTPRSRSATSTKRSGWSSGSRPTRRTSAVPSPPCSPAAPAPRCSSPKATRPRAAATAREAMDIASASGLDLEGRRAQLLLGSALADADRPAAVRELRAAEAALDAGGAHILRDRARRELRRLGHRVDTARRRDPGGLDGLSAREQEVVALVAAGHSNPAIAAELFLSVKTVETHLRNVFGKLGVSSRAEVAAAFARAE